MADEATLALRREILEVLYEKYMENPMILLTWFKQKTPDFSRRVPEVDFLREKGWIEARLGPDSIFNAKLTPEGREFVEAGGFWSGTPEPPPREAAVRRLGIEGLHPEILKASSDLFTDGHYSEAILKAIIALEVRVRAMSGIASLGTDLMGQAFRDVNPPINMKHEQGESGESEQRGFRFLFMGAIAAIRNPKAHELVNLSDPQRALEYLAFASLLMRRLDDAAT